MNAITDAANAALRARPGQIQPTPVIRSPAAAPGSSVDPSLPPTVVTAPGSPPDDPDASPASKPPKSKTPPPPSQDDQIAGLLTPIDEDPKQEVDAKSVAMNTSPCVSNSGSASGSLKGSLG